jgi:hypothetical protein
MSTTSSKNVALQYSGVKEGRPCAMVLVISVGAVDRGACIRDFSQFPAEVEYLYLPVSFVAPSEPSHFEITDDGLVQMIPVLVNSNLKTLTTEQMLERKKQMHMSSFKYLLDDLRSKLTLAAAAVGQRPGQQCQEKWDQSNQGNSSESRRKHSWPVRANAWHPRGPAVGGLQ